MQPNPPTTIQSVRRAQIVDATATVLARDGLSQTSLARIAAEAGLSSPGLISYHFADKDALFVTLTEDLVGRLSGELAAAIAAAADPRDAVGAYIRAFVAWQGRNPVAVRALWRLAAGWKAPGRDRAFDETPLVEPLEAQLAESVRDDLDPAWVAQAVLRAVEGFQGVAQDHPDVDAAAYGAQLAALFERGFGR